MARAARQQTINLRHRAARSISSETVTQPGTASFAGNFTTITAPPGQALALYRLPDCSLSLVTGSYLIGAEKYTQTGSTPSYERVLHAEAGLTTTPDLFPAPCLIQPAPGTGSVPGTFVGTTTTGVNVFADINQTNLMSNGLWVLAGTNTFTFSDFALASASALTVGDFNGDGNGDLVITNSLFTSSGTVSVLLGNADGTFKTGASYQAAGTATVAAVIDDVNNDGKLDLVTVANTGDSGAIGSQEISVLIGKGDGTFAAAQTFAAPTLPGYTSNASTPIATLITADLRHIGKKDLILSNGAVLLGNGDGTFTPLPTSGLPYIAGFSADSPNLASGDFNNDGKPDVVISTGNAAMLYLGNGDGTFTAGNSYAEFGSYGYVSVADLDGDGNADIYIGLGDGGAYGGDPSYTNESYVLMGHGDGTFAGAPVLASAGLYTGAYTGNNLSDLNGDGKPDIVYLPGGQQAPAGTGLTVALGGAAGVFNPSATIAIPASFVVGGHTVTAADIFVSTFAVADVNDDGKPDVVFASNGSTSGAANEAPFPLYFVALGHGDGTFAAAVPYAFPQLAPAGDYDNGLAVSGLQIADFTGAGHGDLIFSFSDQIGGASVALPYVAGLVVLPGQGDGTFKPPVLTTTYTSANTASTYAYSVTVDNTTDLNGDGNADLLTLVYTNSGGGNTTDQLIEFLSNGDGTFNAPTILPTAATPGAGLVLADFNGDGKLDLACVGNDPDDAAQLAISLGNGDGTFGTPTITSIYSGGTGLAAGDFNGDGKIDLALISSISGIYYGNGDGTFTSFMSNGYAYPQDWINITSFAPAVAADLTGSGKTDLLAGSTSLLNIYGFTPALGTTASSTALTASATAIATGTSVTLTATVAGAAGSTTAPTGTVNFFDGTALLGSGTITAGIATYVTTALSTGANSITAVYSGDATFSASTSSAVTVTVTAGIVTATTLSASATSAASATAITFSALVAPASGSTAPAGTVTFLDGATSLGTGVLSSGSATFATALLAVGAHSITAAYGGSSTFAPSTSTAIALTITTVAPGFTLGLSPGSGSVGSGGSVTSMVTLTPIGGFAQPTSLACTGAPQNASCTISPASLTPGVTATSTATITINTGGSTAAFKRPVSSVRASTPGMLGVTFGAGGTLLSLTLWCRRRTASWLAQLGLAWVLLAAPLLNGCGGGSSGAAGGSSTTTPAGTYTLTVTGNAGSLSSTTSYSLTVR